MPLQMNFRLATADDVELLALLNTQLIADEGHRTCLSDRQLAERMSEWLSREYEAVLLEETGTPCGYALYRRDPDYVYLRQFFVCRHCRRQGVGRQAIEWLWENAWTDAERLRIDVLAGNAVGQAFWRSLGFRDYCITMEMSPPPRARGSHG